MERRVTVPPKPETRPELVDRDICYQQVTVLDDAHWLIRDSYGYGHPIGRNVINKQLPRGHPGRERFVRHPDESRPDWRLALSLWWPILWIILNQL